jgi:hypothetical protein
MYFTKKFHSHLTLKSINLVGAENTAVLRHHYLHHLNYYYGLIPALYMYSLLWNQFDHTLRPIRFILYGLPYINVPDLSPNL